MTLVLPQLRQNLTVSRQPADGGAVFIVKDPARGQFYRLREAEHFIANQLDGQTPVEVIRQRAEKEFGTQLSEEQLAQFIAHLEKSGLLERGANGEERKARSRKTVQGSLLYLRVRLLDPDRLLTWLVGKVRFCFTPGFVLLCSASILCATGILISQWGDLGAGLPRLYQLSTIVLVSLAIFLVIAAHEFAHGLTCKHFGGEVREMGFMLMYFQPALYCNVSDAWLFPEKSKRLWVGFAGPFFELFLWSLAVMLWRLTDVDTWINHLAFIVMTSSGIKTLFNFNPLLKWDGYYLLSDWLEIPNLRKKAFSHLGNRIKRLVGAGDPRAEELPIRERRICLAYGLVAAVCSFSLLGLAITMVGGYLIEQSQPLALTLFAGLLGTKLRRRFRKLFGKSSSAPGDTDDPDDDLPDKSPSPELSMSKEWLPQRSINPPATIAGTGLCDARPSPEPRRPGETPANNATEVSKTNGGRDLPEAIETAKSPTTKKGKSSFKKRFFRSTFRFLKFAAASAVTLAILVLVRMELRIAGPLDILPIHNADVRAEVGGIVQEICVDEGQQVRAGDLIARLSDRDLRADLQKNESEIAQARARLRMIEAGRTKEEIQLARTAVAKVEAKLNFAHQRLTRDKSLFEQGLLSQKDFEDTQEVEAMAGNELSEAKNRLEVILNGSRPEEIDAAKADLNRLETQHRYLEEQLRLLNIVSPATGIVATPSRQLKQMNRQLVNKGDLIAKVFDFKTITAEIPVSEKDIADVKVGQTVILKVRAYPDQSFHGKVTAISTSALGSSSASSAGTTPVFNTALVTPKTLLVTTEIDNHDLLLKPEMTGQAKIFCGERPLLELVTRRIARTVKVEFWSWW
jgi:putative peptide zinc metalloprotease protein